MTAVRTEPFLRHGETLTPGRNVDAVDISAGMRQAAEFGYGDAESQMVAEYGLQRWARGEEDGAIKSMLSGGIDLTTAYAIIAKAMTAAQPQK